MICPYCSKDNLSTATHCHSCGSSLIMASPTELASGTTLYNNQFKIIRVLGRGGFGVVYLARKTGTKKKQRFAIKEFFPKGMAIRATNGTIKPSLDQTKWKALLARFKREADVLQSLKHPSSTKINAYWKENGTAFMALEYIEGQTLEARIQSGQLLEFQEAFDLTITILEVLQELHSNGLLHRDIKPANIILGKNRLELIDFGSITEFIKGTRIRVTSRLLTPDYAPLEQYGENVMLAPATDLYAMAATIAEAMTGTRVPNALDRANGASIDSVIQMIKTKSSVMATILEKALELRLENRFQTASQMRESLQAEQARFMRLNAQNAAAKQAPKNLNLWNWAWVSSGLFVLVLMLLETPWKDLLPIALAYTIFFLAWSTQKHQGKLGQIIGVIFLIGFPLYFGTSILINRQAQKNLETPELSIASPITPKPPQQPVPTLPEQTITMPPKSPPPAPVKPSTRPNDYHTILAFDYPKGIDTFAISSDGTTLMVNEFGVFSDNTLHTEATFLTRPKLLQDSIAEDKTGFSSLGYIDSDITYSQDNSSFYLTHRGGMIQRFDSYGQLQTQQLHKPALIDTILSSDQKLLILNKLPQDDSLYPLENEETGILILDAQTLQQKRLLKIPDTNSYITFIATRGNTLGFLNNHYNNKIREWVVIDLQTAKVLQRQPLPELQSDKHYLAAFNDQQVYIALSSTSSTDQRIHAYQWKNNLKLEKNWVSSKKNTSTCGMALSPDGNQLVIAQGSRGLKIRNAKTGIVLDQYQRFSSQRGQQEPHSLCEPKIDKSNRIYVIDSTERKILVLIPKK
jgi:serine/threonine protein kinase